MQYQYEAKRHRVPRIVVLDPVDGVVYSRPARRGGRLVEDASLQDLFLEKGRDALRRFACLNYHGYAEGVVV